ncbi:MAG: M1 family metallopeptidase [Aurantibacter sp.]
MKQLLLLFFLSISFFGAAQHQDKVDFIHGTISIEPLLEERQINGSVIYKLDVLKDMDSVFLDAKNMEFSAVLLNKKEVKYKNTGKTIAIIKKLKAGNSYRLQLDYSAKPKQTVYFLGWSDDNLGNEQIWTQGQGKYSSHWVPSFDDMEEKVEFDFNIRFDKRYSIIANGKPVGVTETDSLKTWRFDMQKPMSSYLLAFVVGNYHKQEFTSTSGIPIENYYYPQDSLKAEPTYRYTKKIFDFMEAEIGVPYPWQNYKQIPVRDFLYAGMENTGATIFSDGYMIDSIAFIDKNYVNVNAHEMAHQWFGNLVTEKNGGHHWLHEGFATYYAYLAEKEIFGEDHFYWKLYKSLQELQTVVDRGEGQSLLNPKASSLTFYEKGAWALYMLRNEIGDTAFKKGIGSYLKKFQFKNVMVSDFLLEMETASGKKLADFRKKWLVSTTILFEEAKNALSMISPSIKSLSEMEAELKTSQSNDIEYSNYWSATNSIHLRRHLLENYHRILPDSLLRKAFETDTIPIRQALLASEKFTNDVPKEKLESLLDDDSYITKENALFTLWQEHPESRAKYLDKTKDVIGLPNKNIRLMWLALAIITEGYEAWNTKQYFDELSGYTGPKYSFEIRQGAFFYLNEAFGFTDRNLLDLIQATNHHAWQFRKYTRNLLDGLLEDDDYLMRIKKLSAKLKPEEIRYLNSKLETG